MFTNVDSSTAYRHNILYVSPNKVFLFVSVIKLDYVKNKMKQMSLYFSAVVVRMHNRRKGEKRWNEEQGAIKSSKTEIRMIRGVLHGERSKIYIAIMRVTCYRAEFRVLAAISIGDTQDFQTNTKSSVRT